MKADDRPGWFMYFDAELEAPAVRDLTADEKIRTLDKPGSVSGLIRSDQFELIDGCVAPRAPARGAPFVFDSHRRD